MRLAHGLAANPHWCYSNLRDAPLARGACPLRALNSAVECHLHTVEVAGSNPAAPTINHSKSIISKPTSPLSFSEGLKGSEKVELLPLGVAVALPLQWPLASDRRPPDCTSREGRLRAAETVRSASSPRDRRLAQGS